MRAFVTTLCSSSLLALSAASPVLADGIFEIDEGKATTYLDVGAAVLSRPDYLGSDETEVSLLPYVNAEYKGRWFFNPITGAGAHVINKKPFRLSTGVYFAPNRDGENTPLLTEDFDIDFGVSARVSARANFKYFVVDAIGSVPITGDMDGAEVQVIATTLLPLSKNLRFAPSVQMNYGTSDWNNSLYGISGEQSAATGFAPVTVSDGVHSYGASGVLLYNFSEDWQGIGLVSYSKLTDDLQDSPLVAREDGVTATLGLARRF